MLVYSVSDWCLWLEAAIHASVGGCPQCLSLVFYKAAEYARFGLVEPTVDMSLLLEIAEIVPSTGLSADDLWRNAESVRKDAIGIGKDALDESARN